MMRRSGISAGMAAVGGALVAALAIAGGVAIADDDGGCEDIEATLMSTADFATFTTAGTISGDLEGTTAFVGSGTSLAPVPESPGVLSYVGALTVTTEDGSFTTSGTGVFEIVPGGAGTQFDRIVSGTGAYAGATGLLFANFTSDATGLNFSSSITGEICGIADDDSSDD